MNIATTTELYIFEWLDLMVRELYFNKAIF